MGDLAVLDVAACLGHFKPPHVTNRFLGARQRIFHGFLESVRRRTDQLNFLVNMISHTCIMIREINRKQQNDFIF